MKDINYMFNIINSNLSEEEKAIKLYSFCNLHSLISNRDLYNTLELEQVEKFKELIRVYRNYEAKGLFKSAKNPYKCTLEEIALRLKKINSVFEIMNSEAKDYAKVEQLLSLFKSAEEFRKLRLPWCFFSPPVRSRGRKCARYGHTTGAGIRKSRWKSLRWNGDYGCLPSARWRWRAGCL